LKGFDLGFGSDGGHSLPFLVKSDDEVVFLKVYLVEKKQAIELTKRASGCYSFSFPHALDKGQHYKLSNTDFYDSISKVGTLEGLDIICVNREAPVHWEPPTIDLARSMLDSLKRSFVHYSDHFLLYYLYRKR